MPYQVKPGPPVEALHLQTVQQARDAEKMLYDILGYRGSVSTTQSIDGEGVTTESARLDLEPAGGGGVGVHAALGEVILYQTDPPEVVACMSHDDFVARYDIL